LVLVLQVYLQLLEQFMVLIKVVDELLGNL
jgi:hypothetical protein